MNTAIKMKLLAVACTLAYMPALHAQQDKNWALPSLRGVDLEIGATTEWMSLVDGGLEEGTDNLGNLDLVLTIDTAEAGWWSNGRWLFYVLGNGGGDPTDRVGDFQTASNIETNNTFKLYEASYEHLFPTFGASLLVGLHDMNADFYALDSALLFINSSFGIGPDTSQVSPSIFSTTAMGIRFAHRSANNRYLNVAVYDGIPGDPDNPNGTHVQFNEGDGVFAIVETGLLGNEESVGKLGIGTWYHTAGFEDVMGVWQDDNAGMYLIGETELWRQGSKAIAGFVQYGVAKGDRNQVARYTGAGVTMTGLVPTRPDDVMGIAVAHAGSSKGLLMLGDNTVQAETAVEISYLVSPLPWLTLQPDLQYIRHPGMQDAPGHSLVAGMRVGITF